MDGMDQNHSHLPHLGGLKEFSEPLKQHIQGVKVHGVGKDCGSHTSYFSLNHIHFFLGITFYQSFENIKNGSNLSIYCLFDTLERWKRQFLSFPEEIYLQLDGGLENANKYMLAACEFLVSKIVVSRLPTGHTYEDIDAAFAHLWTWLRQKTILTVPDFKTGVDQHFGKGKLKAVVLDLYVIPDYIDF